jgi:hypothetical protein
VNLILMAEARDRPAVGPVVASVYWSSGSSLHQDVMPRVGHIVLHPEEWAAIQEAFPLMGSVDGGDRVAVEIPIGAPVVPRVVPS